jgi:hypothetical protein
METRSGFFWDGVGDAAGSFDRLAGEGQAMVG